MPTISIKYRSFDGFERALAAQTAHFTSLNPAVRFVLSHAGPEELYAELVGGGALSGGYDLVLALTDWLPELISQRALRPIDSYLAAAPPADWPHGWSDSMLRLQRDAQGAIYGMPYHDGPEILHYRADLFESPHEQARFAAQFGRPLRVPETWGEFLDVARFFSRPNDGLYGAIVAGASDGHNNVYDFLLHLWSRGGQLLDQHMRPAFNSPQGRAALQFYVDLLTRHTVTPPRALEYDSVAAGVAYAAGEGAMMLNWSGFMAVAQLPPSVIINKTRCARIPRGDEQGGRHTSLNVYWVFGICAGSAQAGLAWQFMRELATPALDRVTSLAGGTGVRLSTWNDAEVRAQFQYYEVIERVHSDSMTLPAIPEYPAINHILSAMTHAAVHGTKSVEQALGDAAVECEQILAHYFV